MMLLSSRSDPLYLPSPGVPLFPSVSCHPFNHRNMNNDVSLLHVIDVRVEIVMIPFSLPILSFSS